MKLSNIETPISTISGIGPSLASAFSKLNIFKISDLLTNYPKYYEDRTKTIPIMQAIAAPITQAIELLLFVKTLIKAPIPIIGA